MNVLGAILGIKLSLDGADNVLSNLRLIKASLVATAVVAAGTDEAMRLQLRELTKSGSLAARQIALIRQEAEQGLFSKGEIFQAVKALDETKASLSEILPLAKELSLRGGGGLAAMARALGTLNGGGIRELGGILQRAGYTIRELRDAGFRITPDFQVLSTPTQALESLKKLLSGSDLTGALGGGVMAKIKELFASVQEGLRSIGDGLLPIAGPILSFMSGMVRMLTMLNDLTGGWASNVLVAAFAFKSIGAALPLLAKLVDLTKLEAIWSGIIAAINGATWGKFVGWMKGAIEAVKAFITVEKIQAAWAAIVAAFSGNWKALAAGAAVAAAVGVGWAATDGFRHLPGQSGNADGPAERPVRRSDTENQNHRMRARMYA